MQCSRTLQKRYFPPMSFRELWNQLCQSADLDVPEEFAIVSRLIWLRRNSFIFQGEFKHPSSVVSQASIAMLELEANRNIRENTQQGEQIQVKWSPPPKNMFKMNWDAAVDKTKCRVGIGVIVRDHRGQMTTALRKRRSLYPGHALAKTCGAYEATKFGLQLDLSQVVLEGDSKQVVNALMAKPPNVSTMDMVTQDTTMSPPLPVLVC
ncbi:uncharacterized protein LOC122315356 [Carya illinoinensis]|uniref:uncharacterized protein LOC122315356 n=1 Tax=Carya illinoinensis TaxID=32201 RepID=UPI001C71FE6E|nr:uncharacterized protein LOC122315356 [Carya illinoinensis]